MSGEIPERCLGCEARGSCVFVHLLPEARREFEQIALARTYPPGSTVVHQGDPAEGVFVVRSGVVRLLHVTTMGKAVVLRLVGPAGILGLTEMVSGVSYPWTMEPVEESVLELLPRQRFLAFLHAHPVVAVDLLTQVSRELCQLQRDLCTSVAGIPLRERLLEKLRELCQAYGVETSLGQRLDLHMTVQDLADQLGCSRQWVSKTLGDLEREGLIRRRARTLLLTSTAGG